MAYDKKQFRAAIEKVLATAPRNINGEAAIQLLLGTSAQESGFGHYLKQTCGPAGGAFQVEPATAQWLEETLPTDLVAWLKSYRDDETIEWALVYRLDYEIACCRLRYFKVHDPLPAAGDLDGQAAYWKKYYNTPLGKGTVDEYIANYKKYIGT